MKFTVKNTNLPVMVLGLSALAMVLRWLLFRFGVDDKGLLVWNHPLEIALWILSGLTVILVLTGIWKLRGSRRFRDNFPPSVPSMLGCLILAVAAVLTVAIRWDANSVVGRVRNLLGIAAAGALVWVGLCRWMGKRPFFLCHMLVCLFFGSQAVLCYRPWSGDPQLQNFVFELLAAVLLMLYAYQQACFDVGVGKRRLQLFSGMLAAYACFTAGAYTDYLFLYLAGGIWAITNLCGLIPVIRRRASRQENPGVQP